jgi:hypothetical protein
MLRIETAQVFEPLLAPAVRRTGSTCLSRALSRHFTDRADWIAKLKASMSAMGQLLTSQRHVAMSAKCQIVDFDTRSGMEDRHGDDADYLVNILPFVARNAPS